MSSKDIELTDLKEEISKMIKKEIKNSLLEENGSPFKDIQNKDELIGWVMRKYFDPQKHSDKIWYDESVNEKNVLDYVSDLNNSFPLTPKELSDLWKIKDTLGTSLDHIDDKDISKNVDTEDKVKYQTGDVTLKDIGRDLGGLTAAMINKIVSSGSDMVKKLTNNVSPWDMNEEQWERLISDIREIRKQVAEVYANNLKEYDSNIKEFLEDLIKAHILNKSDLKIISNKEIMGLKRLSKRPTDEIVNILLNDIEKDDNVFKTYQSAVSKKTFPPTKRGRPKKIK